MTPLISVVLTSWRRPQNVRRQLDALKVQTIRPHQIWIWHNGPSRFAEDLIPPETSVNLISSQRNLGVWPRFLLCLECSAPYACVFDDDTIPGRRWLENCLHSMHRREGLYGAAGLIFRKGIRSQKTRTGVRNSPIFAGWRSPSSEIVECDVVGHSWFFKRDWLRYYALEPRRGRFDHGEDYHFSVAIQRHLGLPTLVPPHPAEDKELWGSIEGRLGNDRVAAHRQRGAEKKKARMHLAYLRAGWQPLYRRKKEPKSTPSLSESR